MDFALEAFDFGLERRKKVEGRKLVRERRGDLRETQAVEEDEISFHRFVLDQEERLTLRYYL
jgi:hypothetical protein